MPLTYDDKYLDILKEIVLSIVDREKVMVFLFGSRARSEHSHCADADVGLYSDCDIPSKVYHKIRNAIEESIVPWDVDIIDFTQADSGFRQEAAKEIVIWNKPAIMKKSLHH